MILGLMCQAPMVPLVIQAPKVTLESLGVVTQGHQVQMGILVIQGFMGIQAHLVSLKIEVGENVGLQKRFSYL